MEQAEGAEAIAQAIDSLATQLKWLGNGDAADRIGAIENLAKEFRMGCQAIADGLDGIANAIERHDAAEED